MAAFRAFSRLSRHSAFILAAPRQTRAFRTPFAALEQTKTSPVETRPAAGSTAPTYEKQEEPTTDPKGATYVVSEPDPADAPYKVPSGAYPTSAPYQNFTATEEPDVLSRPQSSTSSDPAHPTLSRKGPQNPSGVGESAAVRNSVAPGDMSKRGGSDGGLGIMDKASTKQGDGELDTVVNKVCLLP